MPTRLTGRRALVAQTEGYTLIGVVAVRGQPMCHFPTTQQASLADVVKLLQRGAAAGDLQLEIAWCAWAESRDAADRVKGLCEDSLSAARRAFSWFAIDKAAGIAALQAAATEARVVLFDEAERLRRIDAKVAGEARMMTGGRR